MKHSDFSIGTRFFTVVGLWVCTDIGTRTIAAIRVPEDTAEELMGASVEQWLQGPPYALEERLFNEKEIQRAYQSFTDAIVSSLDSRHPGFLSEDMRRLMGGRRLLRKHRALLENERLRGNELLHAYELQGEGNESQVAVLEVFTRTWTHLPVSDFLTLPIPTDADVVRLADHHGRPPRPGLADLASFEENTP